MPTPPEQQDEWEDELDFEDDDDVTAACPGCGEETDADAMLFLSDGTYLCADCWESGRVAEEDEEEEEEDW